MKKLALLVSFIFILSGCSLFADFYNADQLAQEMDKLVSSNNGLIDNELKQIENNEQEIATLLESEDQPDSKTFEEIQAKVTESKGLNDQYKAEVGKIQKQFPDLKAKAAKLEDPEIKKLADTFIADFTKITELHIQLSESYSVFFAAEEQFFKDLSEQKDPDIEKIDEASQKVDEAYNQLNLGSDKFNVSWEAFNKAATGNKVIKEN